LNTEGDSRISTLKALANFSLGVGAQRQPRDRSAIKGKTPEKGFSFQEPFQGVLLFNSVGFMA
jgi:hypothetical protein